MSERDVEINASLELSDRGSFETHDVEHVVTVRVNDDLSALLQQRDLTRVRAGFTELSELDEAENRKGVFASKFFERKSIECENRRFYQRRKSS